MSSQNPDFLTALTKQFRESPTPDAPADGTEEPEASEEPLVKIDEKSAAFGVLERLMKPPARPRPGEKCEMCGVDVEDNHSHIVNLDTRSLMCACRPCYLLFVGGGAGGGRYRAVPSRYLSLADFAMTPAQWDDLQIPVSVAFFFFNSRANQMVAFYPSPAGATESLLRLETWAEISTANPALFHLQPDVEALLVRVGDARGGPNESFIVPIDACYELVGHLRRLWRGFDGGNEAHSEMEAFFDRVRDQAEPVPTELPMSDLDFEVLGAEPDRYAADPVLVFKLRVKENEGEVIQSVSLRCQIMIEPQRRRYTRDEEYRLLAMFGETPRWGSTVKPFLWTHSTTILPGFTGTIDVNLPVTCTYDFEIASSKYMHAVESGDVPLNLLFSGMVFAEAENGFKAEPIAWNKEARYALPGSTWRTMMDFFFPGTGWLRVPRDTLDRLERFKTERGLHSWDHTLETLLKESEATDEELKAAAELKAASEPAVATVPGKERLVR